MRIVLGAIVFAAVILLFLFPIARMGWRLFRGETEMESGGSYGKQFFGRHDQDKPKQRVWEVGELPRAGLSPADFG